MLAPRTFAEVVEGHLDAYLARVVQWVDAGEPWATLAAAAKQDPGPAVVRALGAWVAEDIASQGKPAGAAQASEMRQRAATAERTVGEILAAIAALPASGAPAAAEVRETLVELIGGETDALLDALHQGFAKASGAPLVGVRRQITLADMLPEGPRNERVRFARPVAPPPGLALESLAHLSQDLARLKHYALRDAVAKGGRPLSVSAASSYFKVVRPQVSLDGDLTEMRAMAGIANAADAWTDEARRGLLAGFEDRLRVRQALHLAGAAADVPLVLRSLEIERAASDLKGALSHDPDAAVIPAEGLLALIIAAPLPTGGLTP